MLQILRQRYVQNPEELCERKTTPEILLSTASDTPSVVLYLAGSWASAHPPKLSYNTATRGVRQMSNGKH